MKAKIIRQDGMTFKAEIGNHQLTIDAAEKFGGKNLGPSPKELLLPALGGCTGMDVVSILEKMKVTDFALTIEVEAETADEHPKVLNHINIIYTFKGKDLPEDKIHKAVNLSQDKYCGISAMYSKTAKIDYQIILENDVDNKTD
ncbi:MAG: OsmC family protein [bacterium]